MEADHPPLMLCEFLGSKSDPDNAQPFPSKLNRCKAGGGLDRLPLEQQAELCLGPAHSHCPLRLKAMAKQYTPPLGAAEALPPDEQDQFGVEEQRGGRKRREAQEETEGVPMGDEFVQSPVDFDSVEESSEKDESPPKTAKEPRTQPFRREVEDWMRGLFKDKRNQ